MASETNVTKLVLWKGPFFLHHYPSTSTAKNENCESPVTVLPELLSYKEAVLFMFDDLVWLMWNSCISDWESFSLTCRTKCNRYLLPSKWWILDILFTIRARISSISFARVPTSRLTVSSFPREFQAILFFHETIGYLPSCTRISISSICFL